MAKYKLEGRATGPEDSWGDRDVENLFKEKFEADSDEEAIKEAKKLAPLYASKIEEIYSRKGWWVEIDLRRGGSKGGHVKSLHFSPAAPAQPAVAAKPAKSATFE